MYLDHFHLTENPFRLTPDSEFLFMSRSHSRAKAYLDYTVVSKDGFAVITGEVGAGKTTLLNKLIDEMGETVILAHISQTQLNEQEFLQAVVLAFGLSIAGAGKVELILCLRNFLIQQAAADKRVVLAVDEAQSLSFGVLEEIRQLSGIESNKSKLLNVILIGQPELDRVINAPQLEQLAQRVRLRFHLGPLDKEEARDYILHRLRVAGAKADNIFLMEAYPAILRYTGGIPRLINSLCDMALLTAFVDNMEHVSEGVVEAAVVELQWPLFEDRKNNTRITEPGLEHADGKDFDEQRDMLEFNAIMQSAVHSVSEGFKSLSQQLHGIERQLAEVVKRLGNR